MDTLSLPVSNHNANEIIVSTDISMTGFTTGSAESNDPPVNLKSPTKASKSSSTCTDIPTKMELESILAAAVDPSKSVGSVLAEAGIGSEFHAVGRIKSASNRPLQPQTCATTKVVKSESSKQVKNSDGYSPNDPLLADTSTMPEESHTSETVFHRVANDDPLMNMECRSRSVGMPKSGAFAKMNIQIPCSYKGCQKVFFIVTTLFFFCFVRY